MDKFFSCIKFLGVCFLVYTCLRLNHWVLAIFILIIGGTQSGVGNTFITVKSKPKEE